MGVDPDKSFKKFFLSHFPFASATPRKRLDDAPQPIFLYKAIADVTTFFG
jgi:hypothetical protein